MSHYKPYPAYKDSGVEWIGRLPEHWQVKRLRHVASLNPSPDWQALESQRSEYPFLPMEAIGEVGELDPSRRKPLDECRSGYTYFADGDVAYAKVTPCFENGKGAVIRGIEGGHGFGTTELTVLRPTAIDHDFLYALTYADCFRQPGASEMLGSGGLKRVPDDFTRDYRAGIPPSAEQTAIATALDRETARIDALIAVREQGAIDNAMYRELNRVDTLAASQSLRRLRAAGLLEQKGRGSATYYVPTDVLLAETGAEESLSSNLGGLSGNPERLSSNPSGLSRNPHGVDLPERLRTQVAALGQRATPARMQETIIALCRHRPWQASELAALLKRTPDYVATQHLRPLVSAGVLAYTRPDQPNHPHQAYRATDSGEGAA